MSDKPLLYLTLLPTRIECDIPRRGPSLSINTNVSTEFQSRIPVPVSRHRKKFIARSGSLADDQPGNSNSSPGAISVTEEPHDSSDEYVSAPEQQTDEATQQLDEVSQQPRSIYRLSRRRDRIAPPARSEFVIYEDPIEAEGAQVDANPGSRARQPQTRPQRSTAVTWMTPRQARENQENIPPAQSPLDQEPSPEEPSNASLFTSQVLGRRRSLLDMQQPSEEAIRQYLVFLAPRPRRQRRLRMSGLSTV